MGSQFEGAAPHGGEEHEAGDPDPQAVGWYRPQLRWVFLPQLTSSRNFLTETHAGSPRESLTAVPLACLLGDSRPYQVSSQY